MTKSGNLKRQIRARAEKTGESYTTARRHIVGDRQPESLTPLAPLRLAVAQMDVLGNPTNVDLLRASGRQIVTLMRAAKDAGARLVHFPEGATCFPHKKVMSSLGPEVVGPSDWTRFRWDVLGEELQSIQSIAKDLELWTVFGSVHRLTPPHRPHNSLYVLSDRGELVSRYDERMLSKTKISFMYSPGAGPATFQIDGYKFGCALGMESHFPELFTQYEALEADCVLFSTTGGEPSDAPMFAAGTCGHAATNGYWISFSVPAAHSLGAPSGIVAPNGTWAAKCANDGSSGVTTFEISIDREDRKRSWRRVARSDLYSAQRVESDGRSDDRGSF